MREDRQLELIDYDGTPYRPRCETSRLAALSVAPKRRARLDAALAAYRQAGADGLTDYELSDACGWWYTSSQGIRAALADAGLIRRAGRRAGQSGRLCDVWILI